MMKWEFEFDERLRWTAELRNNLYNKANLAQKKNLLEVGCVTGELLKEIGVMYDLKLYGIDNDAIKIEYARVNLEKNMIDAKLMVMDISNNSFEDRMFDIIISYFSFLWIKNLKKSMSEIHRILTDDGTFKDYVPGKKAKVMEDKVVVEKPTEVIEENTEEEVMLSELPSDLSKCTVVELKAYCTERKISYDKKVVKQGLIDLLTKEEEVDTDEI